MEEDYENLAFVLGDSSLGVEIKRNTSSGDYVLHTPGAGEFIYIPKATLSDIAEGDILYGRDMVNALLESSQTSVRKILQKESGANLDTLLLFVTKACLLETKAGRNSQFRGHHVVGASSLREDF